MATRALLLRLFQGLDDLDSCQLTDPERRRRPEGEPRFSTGFLVSGDRGTGKTTVLFSAAYATQHPDQFFGIYGSNGRGAHDGHAYQGRYGAAPSELTGAPKEGAQELHHETTINGHGHRLKWLDVLDMEFLPERANLLTTLLVRIRDALDRGTSGREQDGHGEESESQRERERANRLGVATPRILQAGEDLLRIWDRLDELIRDGTPMWEGVAVSADPQRGIEPQIRAAETYAGMKERVRSALDGAADAFSRQIGLFEKGVVLVLPIDNADRSPEHVHDVLKLIRMVHSPRLWFVIGASQSDLNTYLESSFRKKLSGGGKDGRGAASDPTVVTRAARRQAAAMHLAALPLAHRVEVGCMEPAEVLNFSGEKPTENIEELLRLFKTGLPLRRHTSGPLEDLIVERVRASDGIQRLHVRRKFAQGSEIGHDHTGKCHCDQPLGDAQLEQLRQRLEKLGAQGWKKLDDGKTVEVEVPTPGVLRAVELDLDPASSQITLLDLMLLVSGDVVRAREERFLSFNAYQHLLRSQGYQSPPEAEKRWRPWFTNAGYDALTMPVKRAEDLRQAAERWLRQRLPCQRLWDESGERPSRLEIERTIELAREMLHSAIAESNLSDDSCRILNEIIARDDEDLVCLDLWNNPIKAFRRSRERHTIDVDLPPMQGSRWLASRVVLSDHFGFELVVRETNETLERNVAGWLMVLHDLLQGRSESRVVLFDAPVGPLGAHPVLVETVHQVVHQVQPNERASDQATSVRMRWTVPEFATFFDVDFFARVWEALLQPLFVTEGSRCASADLTPSRPLRSVDSLVQFLSTAWISCSLATIVRDEPREKDDWRRAYWRAFNDDLIPILCANAKESPERKLTFVDLRENLVGYANLVDKTLAAVHQATRNRHQGIASAAGRPGEDINREWAPLRRWMELSVWLLGKPEYLGTVQRPPRNPELEASELSSLWTANQGLLDRKRGDAVREFMRKALQPERNQKISGLVNRSRTPGEEVSELCKVWFDAVEQVVKTIASSQKLSSAPE